MKTASKDGSNNAATDGLPHSIREAMAMQEIEENPLSPNDVALLVMLQASREAHQVRFDSMARCIEGALGRTVADGGGKKPEEHCVRAHGS